MTSIKDRVDAIVADISDIISGDERAVWSDAFRGVVEQHLASFEQDIIRELSGGEAACFLRMEKYR